MDYSVMSACLRFRLGWIEVVCMCRSEKVQEIQMRDGSEKVGWPGIGELLFALFARTRHTPQSLRYLPYLPKRHDGPLVTSRVTCLSSMSEHLHAIQTTT